jgi:predicted transcriptional regulator
MNVPLGLTVLQLSVARLIAEGAAIKEISRALGLKPRTVRYHADVVAGKIRKISPDLIGGPRRVICTFVVQNAAAEAFTVRQPKF